MIIIPLSGAMEVWMSTFFINFVKCLDIKKKSIPDFTPIRPMGQLAVFLSIYLSIF